MKNFFRKTILLLTLAGIVFLGGGVGVARAADTPPVKQTATVPATIKGTVSEGSSEQLTGVDQSTVEAKKTIDLVACGGTLDMVNPNCWMPLLTYRVYQVVSLVLLVSGSIFDFMLALSIDKAYLDQGFVYEIWAIMRDVSNMMFIFILLYAGIRTMLLGDDWKKPVMMVVVIALLINFSLFFTKVVIDAGNVLAVGVYSRMGVVKESGSHKAGGEPEHNISETIVKAFAPEKFLTLSGGADRNLAPTVFIIAGVISGVAAFIFFKAAFLFMGRLLAFWFLMMWSPIAFIMLASPQLASKFKFGFSDWFDMLVNQAFVAPVFLFMIYIIMTFIEKGNLLKSIVSPTSAGFFFDNIFIPIVTAAMVVYALKKSFSIAESMAGYFGKIGAGIGNKALGLGLGMASGGATMAIGGAANKLFQSDRLQKMAKGEGTGNQFIDKWGGKGVIGKFAGRQGTSLADETRNATFDARNIKAFGIGKGLGAGTGSKEGFMQKEEKWMKEQQKKTKLMEVTEEGKKDMPEYKSSQENIGKEKEAKKTYEEAREAVHKSRTASMAGDASIKKIEAEKRVEAALNGVQKAKAIEEPEGARIAEQKALEELRDAREEAKKAADTYDSSNEVAALEKAAGNLNEIRKIVAEDKEIIKRKVTEENETRRGVSGKSATLFHYYTTQKERNNAIDKIRSGPTPEERAEEDLMKSFKKMMEKEKKGRGEPTTAKEKGEKPKEEGPLETK